MNAFRISDALTAEIDRVRKDKEFMDALEYVVERDKEIFDRLADK